MIDTGRYDRLVTVQGRTLARGTSKAPVETWADLFTVFMAIVQEKSRQDPERYVGSQLSARQDTVFMMRYRLDMDPESVSVASSRRLLLRGRIYDIVKATPIGFRDEVKLETLAKADTE